MFGHYKQQGRFDNAACRDHDGNANASVRAGHRIASGQVQCEHRGIDQRTAALLAQHVEHAFCGADGRARDESDRQDEHQRITGLEAWSEQPEDRFAERQDHRNHRERRPERPAHGHALNRAVLAGESGSQPLRQTERGRPRGQIFRVGQGHISTRPWRCLWGSPFLSSPWLSSNGLTIG